MMIRSIVAPQTQVSSSDRVPALRRNLKIEDLEVVIQSEKAVWIDLVDPQPDEIDWLQNWVGLHPLVVEDLRRIDRRPSLLAYTDYIFLSLFQPVFSRGKILGEEIHCIITETCFITVRHTDTNTESVSTAYERAAKNPKYWDRDVAYFLYLTMQAVVDSYYPIIDNISNQLNDLEERLLTQDANTPAQQTVYRTKQQLIALRQMVAPQREVLSNAIGEERLARTSENRDLFRHLYERLLRVYDLIDSQRDLSSNVLDLIQSRSSAQLGEAVNRLTIFSMIFLPLTFIIGIFELNFVTTEPELRIPIPGILMFVILLMVMSIIVGMMIYTFRKRGWL